MIFLDTLNIVIGPTGSGKSLFQMLLIEYFLMYDKRPIITTLAVDLPRIAEYMQEKYGDKAPPNVGQRIFRIYKEDLATFWRCVGVSWDTEYGAHTLIKRGRFGGPDWQEFCPACIYMLDEAQTAFKAREFMKNSGEFLDAQPQMRKAGHTIICASPASSLLDKAFRDMANQCIVLTNMYKIKVKGFTAPRKIVARVFTNCPPVKGEEELTKFEFTIDAKGLASCYRTQEGVGIKGIGADIGAIARGVPWWMIIPIAIGAGLLVWKLLSISLHGGIHWGLHKLAISDKSNATAAAKVFSAVAPTPAPSPFAGLAGPGARSYVPKPPEPPPPLRKATARGFAVLDGRLYIDTRLGQVVVPAHAWTNTGEAFLANGCEWSLPEKSSTTPGTPGFR